jgi:hypothetical protein
MKTPATPRATNLPPYLRQVGERVLQERQQSAERLENKKLDELKAAGKMTTAQFKQAMPTAINHGHGNFEDQATGQIWEARDGMIYRRADDSIRDVLTAINERPDMSDDEYNKLISQFTQKGGL